MKSQEDGMPNVRVIELGLCGLLSPNSFSHNLSGVSGRDFMVVWWDSGKEV